MLRPGAMPLERLQKVLARAGVASRRAAEALILAGRVKVDGKPVLELGAKADVRSQRVELDGLRLMPQPLAYIVLHKPRGYVTTLKDPEGRPTVAELVRADTRLVPVGRLDFATSGVLLMTNDGDFAAALTHPRHKVPKIYVAKVAGRLDDTALEAWRRSIVVDGKATRPAEVRRLRWDGERTWLEVTLHEGRNRQVHRIGEAAGSTVLRLVRTAHAGVTHEGLRPGEWRYLTVDEMVSLQRKYGVPQRVRPQASGTAGKLAERNPRKPRPQHAAAGGSAPRSTSFEPKASGSGSTVRRGPRHPASGSAAAVQANRRGAEAPRGKGARSAGPGVAGAGPGDRGGKARRPRAAATLKSGRGAAGGGPTRAQGGRPSVPPGRRSRGGR